MEIRLLGTSAAEGFPGLFCRCEHCEKARALGGKNIRTRTSAIIDDTLKIDFPPDTNLHVLRDGIDMSKMTDLLITHTHTDHLYAEDISMRLPIYAKGNDHPLHIYGHDLPLYKCRTRIERIEQGFTFNRILPYKEYQVGEFQVTGLLADHDKNETCFIYMIEKNGKRILYGHDTGWFPEETWEWLKGRQIDVAILDCTNGLFPVRNNHLNIEAVIEMQSIFKSEEILNDHGKVIVTHFSHNIGLLHEDLETIFQPHDIEVAYDGMRITI
ncbi:MBL fold metallo-hydrolase [Bacillus massilinigeriensis]|uniref:MBL fold metallo-hydrolase n=1 Tax=Bacillus massilionigeriensis TaxID=1805475 RepID=UPI00096B5833|nr:MBL fold metallo-hydrolase [Bacillus massilionigeriensis]